MDPGIPERADSWRVNLAWRLYGPAPAALDGVLRTFGRAVRPLGDLRVCVVVQRGPVHPDGEVGALVVAGRGALDNPVSARFFLQPPQTEPVGVVPP